MIFCPAWKVIAFQCHHIGQTSLSWNKASATADMKRRCKEAMLQPWSQHVKHFPKHKSSLTCSKCHVTCSTPVSTLLVHATSCRTQAGQSHMRSHQGWRACRVNGGWRTVEAKHKAHTPSCNTKGRACDIGRTWYAYWSCSWFLRCENSLVKDFSHHASQIVKHYRTVNLIQYWFVLDGRQQTIKEPTCCTIHANGCVCTLDLSVVWCTDANIHPAVQNLLLQGAAAKCRRMEDLIQEETKEWKVQVASTNVYNALSIEMNVMASYHSCELDI